MNDIELMKKRAIAYAIDSAICMGIMLLNFIAIGVMVAVYGNDRPPLPILLALFFLMFLVAAVAFGFFLMRDAFEKSSPGKRLVGLRVVDHRSGAACTRKQSFARNGMLLALGVIDMIFAFTREDGRRLGDDVAGTKVISSE